MKKESCTIIQLIKKKYKWGKGKKLQTIKMEEMPKYIFKNIEKYKLWLDI